MSRIYTRTGDQGSTGLASGERLSKDDARITVIGDLDELNCALGAIRSQQNEPFSETRLAHLQNILFELGAELALAQGKQAPADYTRYLEDSIDILTAELPPLKQFILPGGCLAAATCHQARAICRRAERHLVRLQQSTPINQNISIFINRLSDFLFVLSRYINQSQQVADFVWKSEKTLKL